MAVATTGKNHIDSLLEGYSWTGNSGQSASVSYSFGASIPAGMKSAFVAAMQTWSKVANVTFHEVTSGADIDFFKGNLNSLGAGVVGVTYPSGSGSTLTGASVGINSVYFTSPASIAKGSLGFTTILHELGHALGLKHSGNYGPGESGPFLPTTQDTMAATVMSYHDGSLLDSFTKTAVSPMIFDVAAIQHLYGTNTSYNSGHTVYTMTSSSLGQTIWDGGGIDTLDASSATTAVTLDLREGLGAYSRVGASLTWNAYGSHIEYAVSGSGNDTLRGNGLNNRLISKAGNDTLDGGAGNDTLYGGVGHDRMLAGVGDDSLYGGAGNDVMEGSSGFDTIFGEAGNDMINGGSQADKLYGNAGNDTLFGGGGDDTLYGGAGVDTFYFKAGSGNDGIGSFEGEGVAGGDVIRLASVGMNGSGYTSLAQLLSHITYSTGKAVIDLGSSEILLTGITKHLVASDFLIG